MNTVWTRVHGPSNGLQPAAPRSHEEGYQPDLLEPHDVARITPASARSNSRTQFREAGVSMWNHFHHGEPILPRGYISMQLKPLPGLQ